MMPRYSLIRAYVWWCEDEVCDCTQPIIEKVSERQSGRGYDFERLWEGQFFTDSHEYRDRRWADQRAEEAERMWEFRKAAIAHGIRLTRSEFGNWSGERPA